MRRRHSVNEAESDIDMTPMLDIVFIMLIFFIVTTSFIKESGINVNRPTANTSAPVKNANILVAIAPDDSIWIDRRKVDIRAVRANIERLRAENPEGAVVVTADKDSRTGLLIKVMDQIRSAGVLDASVSAIGD